MCKKKSDCLDSGNCKSPTPFNRIINRLHVSFVTVFKYSVMDCIKNIINKYRQLKCFYGTKYFFHAITTNCVIKQNWPKLSNFWMSIYSIYFRFMYKTIFLYLIFVGFVKSTKTSIQIITQIPVISLLPWKSMTFIIRYSFQ